MLIDGVFFMYKCIGCYILAVIILLSSSAVFAAGTRTDKLVFERGTPLTVSWDLPKFRENGEPLKLIEISHFMLKWTCDTFESGIFRTLKVLSPRSSVSVSTDDFWGKCQFIIASVDTDGLYSDYSDPKTVLIKLPRPKTGGFR